MNGSHLSSEQLSEWALGGRSAPMSAHVASCPECRAKVETFDEVLAGFRNSVHRWSDSTYQPATVTNRARPKIWLVASACAMALMLIFIVREGGVSKRQAEPHLSAQDDAALLTQIDQEVSRTVPAAMDPLSSLVAGDGAHSPARTAKAQ